MYAQRIRYKLLAAVGVAVGLGLVGTSAFYTHTAEDVIVSQQQRTLHKLTEAIGMSIESMMVEGHADLAPEYAHRLRTIPEVKDLRILRIDGTEAFRDNLTIKNVNELLGEQRFKPRSRQETVQVVSPSQAEFVEAVGGKEAVIYYGYDENGSRVISFLDPIFSRPSCRECHEGGELVRGVVKVTSSMAPVERDILRTREESLLVLAGALLATMLLTGYMLGRTVLRPIENVTQAMARVSGGDLAHKVPVSGGDELGRMAESFNVMTAELRNTYDGLRREQDKLTTIIQGAREAIVVTDASGAVVLVNPAAEQLLGKTAQRIAEEGFDHLLDDPALMRALLAAHSHSVTETVAYSGHVFLVSASSIYDSQGKMIGSAALLRDVTEERRLQEELRRLSTTDGLTGLYNRRHLDESLRRELNRANHTGSPVSVIMFDVDHFKRFNDEHGHEQGDRVLQEVARLMRQALRKYDVPCRYGGEEFLAILPSTDLQGAASVAERLRRDVEETRVDGLAVTISLGVASLEEVPARSAEGLVEAADAALYRSKQGGRNRVSVAERPPESAAAPT